MEDDRENCMMTIRVIYSLRQRVSEWHIMAAEIVWTFRIYGRKDEVLHKTYELIREMRSSGLLRSEWW